MLGDVGANVLGAVVGLAVVLETSPTTRHVIVVVLLALNVISERVSFSRVIDRVPLLHGSIRSAAARPRDRTPALSAAAGSVMCASTRRCARPRSGARS